MFLNNKCQNHSWNVDNKTLLISCDEKFSKQLHVHFLLRNVAFPDISSSWYKHSKTLSHTHEICNKNLYCNSDFILIFKQILCSDGTCVVNMTFTSRRIFGRHWRFPIGISGKLRTWPKLPLWWIYCFPIGVMSD